MIEYRTLLNTNDIFNAGTEAIVNIVNCDGRFERGVSLKIFEKYKNYANWYTNECRNKRISVGKSYVYWTKLPYPKAIVSAAFKRGWRSTAWEKHILQSLQSASEAIDVFGFKSVAIPLIGVHKKDKMLENILEAYSNLDTNNVEVFIFSRKIIK